MIIELNKLSPKQSDFLRSVAKHGNAKRKAGDYICFAGDKPTCARTVLALHRMQLITFINNDSTNGIMLTEDGRTLINTGTVVLLQAETA